MQPIHISMHGPCLICGHLNLKLTTFRTDIEFCDVSFQIISFTFLNDNQG